MNQPSFFYPEEKNPKVNISMKNLHWCDVTIDYPNGDSESLSNVSVERLEDIVQESIHEHNKQKAFEKIARRKGEDDV